MKKFEVDLSRDLIVIYGKNNIGKSYAMSVVYLLLKYLSDVEYPSVKKIISNEITNKKIEILKKHIIAEKECDITDKISDIIQNILNRITVPHNLEKSFKNTFGQLASIKNSKVKRNPIIQLDTPGFSIQLTIGEKIRVKGFSLVKEVIGRDSKVAENIDHDRGKYILNTAKPGFRAALIHLIEDILRIIIGSIQNEVEKLYFLPASRSGLYTGSTSFFPIIAELSKSRAYTTQKIELPGLAEPIADYILHLSQCSTSRAIRNPHVREIGKLIEKNILKGDVWVDNDTHRLYYSPGDLKLELDMGSVSSMVSELSPVVAFLKYILGCQPGRNTKKSKPKTGYILFIEEPEAHLHPEVQVQLADIFVKLIHAGVKLIISSHSSYIFNKLSNMVIDKTLDLSEYAPIIMTDTDKGSISKLMEADDLGVEDENFIDTAVTLYEEREHILEELNQGVDD
jgi:hypothetical protein